MVTASLSATGLDFEAGTIFGGYRIERLLGRGGMGTVYAAEQLEDGRQVAVKVLAAGLGTEEDRARFFREGRTAAAINHPNTVYVYRTEEIDGLPTITMELVVGGTLEEKVEQRGPLPVEEAIRDILQVVDGLDAAQRLGILHRDIKPANCFVGPNGEVKVGDFGLSRPVDQVDQARLTQTGLFLGTPVYSSPEQLMGETLDLRSDIYAVGATLYYLLSGKLPFDADNAVRLIAVVMSGTPTPLIQQRGNVPEALNALVMKCLARSRDERFADYASLRSALEACLPNEATPAPLVRRFVAGMVDNYAITAISSPLWLPLASNLGMNMAEITTDRRAQLLQMLVALPLELLWYGVLEGRLGWSPGKLLVGLRVARRDGSPPGLARGAIRGLLILAPGFVAVLVSLPIDSIGTRAWLTGVVTFVLFGVLFFRARKANGYLAEHDRLTDTRVVRARRAAARHVVSTAKEDLSVPVGVSDQRVGPYEVIGPVPSPADVVRAVDPDLRRLVWVWRRPVGTAAVSVAERQMVRSGCLRWIAGRRSDTEAWDAYAAIDGAPLRERLGATTTWSEVHGWLTDLTDELLAREQPAAELARATIDHVFIGQDGRAVLLPFSVGEGIAEPPASHHLMAAVATLVTQKVAGATRAQWPLTARSVLATLDNPSVELASVRERLARAGEHTEGMTRRRRIILWAGLSVPTLFMAVFVGVIAFYASPKDEAQLRMEPLLGYLAESDKADSLGTQRGLVGVYVAGHFREQIAKRRDGRDTSILSSREWKRADSLVAANPTVSAEQLRVADRLVDSTWNGIPPGAFARSRDMPLIAAVVLVVFALMCSLGAAAFARRGLIMRSMGLELVNGKGERAGRLRLVWRQLLIWAPLVALSLVPILWMVTRTGPPLKAIAFCVVSVSLVAASLVTAWRSPARGLTERLSGTTMVPE